MKTATRFSRWIVCALMIFPLMGAKCGRESVSPDDAPLTKEADFKQPITVEVEKTWGRLLAEEDTDADKKITVDDKNSAAPPRGDLVFELVGVDGSSQTLRGAYALSNLLQELTRARERGETTTIVTPERIDENPVDRIARLIREDYWDHLTRRVDEDHLPQMFKDDKVTSRDQKNRVYVPPDDEKAKDYFNGLAEKHPDWDLVVETLPAAITPQYMFFIEGAHGVLCLKLVEEDGRTRGVPFVAPGGRFNEMYGWDSYFESLGLIADGRVDLARAMADNFVYQIDHYGKILNANRTYYLTRSQPPFLTSLAEAVYRQLPPGQESKAWLAQVLAAAVKEHETVWTARPRLTGLGLSRYHGQGVGPCPEVEPGHYDAILKPRADSLGISPKEYLDGYKTGRYQDPALDRFFIHDRAIRESGHDTTYRFDDRTADFVTVDLNSLLYKYETDLARLIETELGGSLTLPGGRVITPQIWKERAEKRKALINQYMWDPDAGMFFDYDLKEQKRSTYVSATNLYPLWAGLATAEQAKVMVDKALPLLEAPGGLLASTEDSRGPLNNRRPARQWDYPNGWPPHQMLIWKGLENYGLESDARRLAYKWLYMIARNAADYNGTVPEKYDVVARTHHVFAEYGNVGTKFSYITREGFGWMNASYQVGLTALGPELKEKLRELTPPEEVFK